MNAVGAAILLVLIFVVLSARPRWAAMAMMAGVLYLPLQQQVSVLGLNIFGIRFIELAVFLRVVVRDKFSFSKLNSLDWALLLAHGYKTVVYLMRCTKAEGAQASEIASTLDALLCYFAFRALIPNVDEFKWFLRMFPLLLAPYVALLLVESFTSNNPFSFMGGVVLGGHEEWYRHGRIRVCGSFGHPSLNGTLGGTFLPLYIGLSFIKKERNVAFIGLGLCLANVWASNSGGPASCVAVSVIGWALWKLRTRMRLVRWGMVFFILLGALLMEAPIWYLLARVSDLTGGDGYHRSYLLDIAFQNIDKWWLAGMPILDTSQWFPYTNGYTGGADMTNNFLMFGITSGLGAMVLLIILMKQSFSWVGKAMRIIRSISEGKDIEPLYFGLGVMLAAHVFNWLGITYWDQSYVIWFMHLAVLRTLTDPETITAHLKSTEAEACDGVIPCATLPLSAAIPAL